MTSKEVTPPLQKHKPLSRCFHCLAAMTYNSHIVTLDHPKGHKYRVYFAEDIDSNPAFVLVEKKKLLDLDNALMNSPAHEKTHKHFLSPCSICDIAQELHRCSEWKT